MNRIWSILFLLVPILGMTAFVFAACGWSPLDGAWLPKNLSAGNQPIDGLLHLVHSICAVFFVGLGLAMSVFIWKFASANRQRALYIRGNARLEVLWSVVPGLILMFIAVYQLQIWSAGKLERPQIDLNGQSVPQPALVHVIARQFAWEFHYAGRDQCFDTGDDFFVENLMVVPEDETIVIELRSRDVIHSFFVPQLRMKQDVVPGMQHLAWFRAARAATMTILCAELCGEGHYRMNAMLKVVPRTEFDDWIRLQQDTYDPRELASRADTMP